MLNVKKVINVSDKKRQTRRKPSSLMESSVDLTLYKLLSE